MTPLSNRTTWLRRQLKPACYLTGLRLRNSVLCDIVKVESKQLIITTRFAIAFSDELTDFMLDLTVFTFADVRADASLADITIIYMR